jgi:hypothetical protein
MSGSVSIQSIGNRTIRSNLFASKQAKRISTTIVAAMHPPMEIIFRTAIFLQKKNKQG